MTRVLKIQKESNLSAKFEQVLKYNSDLSGQRQLELAHLYYVLLDEFDGELEIKPIKNGFKLTKPGIGKINAIIWTEANQNFFYRGNKLLKEVPINPVFKGKRKIKSVYLNYGKDVYFYPKDDYAQKVIGLPSAKRKTAVYDEDYVIASIRTAFDTIKL